MIFDHKVQPIMLRSSTEEQLQYLSIIQAYMVTENNLCSNTTRPLEQHVHLSVNYEPYIQC